MSGIIGGIKGAMKKKGGGVTTGAGSQAYTSPGTYSWICPAGVYSVCAVAIGGGSSGCYYTAGAGGGLSYINNYAVTPGQSYSVVVGAGGTGTGWTYAAGGGSSIFTITAGGGAGSDGNGSNSTPQGGSGTAGNGGLGEGYFRNNGILNAGGGGAGGYTSNGSIGSYILNTHGCGNGGGGTGIFGGAAGGAGGTAGYNYQASATSGNGGAGGSGGTTGTLATSASNPGTGGSYGGGGGSGAGTGYTSSIGGGGAVRIIWGAGRAFPNTNTGAGSGVPVSATSSITTASSNRGTAVSNAFNTSGSYFIFGNVNAGNYLQVAFGNSVYVTQVTYRNAVGSNWAPTSVKIQYSNDGSTWYDAVTYSDNASTSVQTITVPSGSGSFWRLYQNSSTRAGSGGYEWHFDSFSMVGS